MLLSDTRVSWVDDRVLLSDTWVFWVDDRALLSDYLGVLGG